MLNYLIVYCRAICEWLKHFIAEAGIQDSAQVLIADLILLNYYLGSVVQLTTFHSMWFQMFTTIMVFAYVFFCIRWAVPLKKEQLFQSEVEVVKNLDLIAFYTH